MDPKTAQLIVSLTGLVLQYGVPAVAASIATLDKETITQEDIDALPGLIKPPEEYK